MLVLQRAQRKILFAKFATWTAFAYFNWLLHKCLSAIYVQSIGDTVGILLFLSISSERVVPSISGNLDSIHDDSR